MKRLFVGLMAALAVSVMTMAASAKPPRDTEGGGRRPGPPAEGRRGPPEGRQGPDGRPGHRPPPPPLMKALDTDQDGELSPTEIENAVAALKTLDRDGDGTLSHDEIRPRFRGPHPRRPAGPQEGRGGQRDGEGQQRGKGSRRPPGPAQQ